MGLIKFETCGRWLHDEYRLEEWLPIIEADADMNFLDDHWIDSAQMGLMETLKEESLWQL